MSRKKPIIIAYDISKNKIRGKVFRILKEWRIGGQKSVHECWLTKRQAEELFLQISELLNMATDTLLMVWLANHRRVLHRGLGKDSINNRIRLLR